MSNKSSDISEYATPFAKLTRDGDLNEPGSGLSSSTKSLPSSPCDGEYQDGDDVTSPSANPEINDDEDVKSKSRILFTCPREGSRGIEASRSSIGTDTGDDDIETNVNKSSATDLADTDISVADKGINTPPKNRHDSFESKSDDPEALGIPADDTHERPSPRSMSDNSPESNQSATPASCQQESKIAYGQTPITINSNESDDEFGELYEDHPTIIRKREIQKLVNEIIEDWKKEIDKNAKMEQSFNVLKERFEDMKLNLETKMGRIDEFQLEMKNEVMDVMQSFEDDLNKALNV
eukprot:scaffold150086_cov56-Cyclotella_meneghiniana.AAC.1